MGYLLKQSKNSVSVVRSIFLIGASTVVLNSGAVLAQDDEGFSLSANAAIVSDYRFRGISLSDKDPAVQGGFDVGHSSGFYIGTWGSSIEAVGNPVTGTSEMELDIYGGYGGQIGDLSTDIGFLAYLYPGSEGTHYFELYGSVGGQMNNFAWTLGAAYVWDQDNTGDDNIYIYLDGGMPLGDTGLSLSTHLAFEDGAFGNDKWDWSAGLSYDFEQFSISVSYVDTNIENSRTAKGGVVAMLSASF